MRLLTKSDNADCRSADQSDVGGKAEKHILETNLVSLLRKCRHERITFLENINADTTPAIKVRVQECEEI